MTAPMIAVLDSDRSFLSLMHDLLAEEGYRTLRWQASEQARAHALLKRVQPHLVILDLWLAERDDGWTFLKRLWGDVDTTHIPAIIVTGEPNLLPVQPDVLRAMHCQLVRKPFDLQDLLDAIAKVLGPSPVQWDRGARAHAAMVVGSSMTDMPQYALGAIDGDGM